MRLDRNDLQAIASLRAEIKKHSALERLPQWITLPPVARALCQYADIPHRADSLLAECCQAIEVALTKKRGA